MGNLPLSPEAWRAAGRRFAYRSQDIFYRDSGASDDKPVLLLIHGFPTASWDFYRIWDALAVHYRLIAPDLIGFGFSAKPRDYSYSLVDQAALCADLCARQGIRQVDVLAHDYGVSVAQELLVRHEDKHPVLRLRSITFLNGGLFPETHRSRPVQRLLLSPLGSLLALRMREDRFSATIGEIFGPATQPDADEVRAFWQLISHNHGQQIMHKLIRYIPEREQQRGRWLPAMQFTKVPMRLINGSVDPVSGAHMADRYCELLPKPDVVRLPQIGHYPQMEAPDDVLKAFFEFQQKLARR